MLSQNITKGSPKKIWHIIMGGTIGNLTEWYNFLLYGYFASAISPLFFPSENKLLSIMLGFTVFALSFFARPFGSILFGWIGDTYGRQRALLISLFLMAIPTLLISLLPTYQRIGVFSPILLCILRICQGLSTGGEHTGSAVYLAESAPPGRYALWVTSVPASAAIGILISSTTSLLIINSLTQVQLLAWGWRLGYLMGFILCVFSILLRLKLPETPFFIREQHTEKYNRSPISKLMSDSRQVKKLLTVIGLASCWGVFYQILFIWMPTYLTHIQHLMHNVALQINSIFIACFAVLILIVSCFINEHRKFVLATSSILMAVFAYPLFKMLSSGSLCQVFIAMGTFTLIFSLFIPTAFLTMLEKFDTAIRYTGLSFGFNIGLALFGGTCPLIVTWLISATKNQAAPSFYLIFAALVAFVLAISEKNYAPHFWTTLIKQQ